MSDELRGVVVCHGRLAGALVEAAEQISGVTGALVAVSNTGCDRGTLEERVAEAVGAGPGRGVRRPGERVLPRSRCSTGSARARRRKVVTGVNLAMLVDFVFHRDAPARRGGGARRRSPAARRSGCPDADRALPGGRPADARPGGDRLGPAARRRAHRAGGRRAWPRAPGSRTSTAWRCRPRSRSASPPWPRRPAQLAGWQAGTRRGLLLTGDLETMAALHRGRTRRWCTGSTSAAIHHRPGRRERLPYLYLTDEELRAARRRWRRRRGGHRAGPAHAAAGGAPGAGMSELAPHSVAAARGLGHAWSRSTW